MESEKKETKRKVGIDESIQVLNSLIQKECKKAKCNGIKVFFLSLALTNLASVRTKLPRDLV